jgi:hypothetical protein
MLLGPWKDDEQKDGGHGSNDQSGLEHPDGGTTWQVSPKPSIHDSQRPS